MKLAPFLVPAFLLFAWPLDFLGEARAQETPTPPHLRDRGTGIPTSMFGTYVRPGELLVYPFFESYMDPNAEYKPSELGHGLDRDFRGEYEASEGLLFLAYGFTDRLALELEASMIRATLERAPDDPSSMPAKLAESGIGNIEGQIRYRWLTERAARPELFSYFEAVAPTQVRQPLIATPDWELKLGSGLTRGTAWGTFTIRAAVEYALANSQLDAGEYALEYLRRISPAWRVYLGLEGTQDEATIVSEVQWHLRSGMFLKVNNGLGLTPKAVNWAPEVGMVFVLPVARR